MLKTKKYFVALLVCLFSGVLSAQIVGTDAFLMAPGVEVGIHSDGYEGSQGLPPFPTHYRGFIGRLGFVANPQNDGWVNYDGDFFMPGSPENRFGIEVDGVTYFNSSAVGSTIPSSGLSNYQVIDKCKFIDWDGSVGGIDIHMTYKLDTTDYYYTVQIALTNTTASDKNDVYFYKALDPDNNMDLAWGFATVNTNVFQPTPECPKALVTATDNNGWESYIGLGGLGENMRVAHGGFFVDDASAVYDGTWPYDGVMGSTLFSDEAIAICHKDAVIPAGETTTFEFVVVMNGAQVNEAMLEMFNFTYEEGPGFTEVCSDTTGYLPFGGVIYETDGVVDTLWRCTVEPSLLWVEAPGVVISEYNLAWLDMETGDTLGIEAYTTVIPGTEADTAHITCFLLLGDCFGGIGLANEYVIITIQSPEIYVPEQTFCADSILLTDIEVIDTAYVEDTETVYYEEYPDGVDDVTGLWPSAYYSDGDIVYVMVKNTDTDCYDVDTINIDLNGVSAGLDGTVPDACNTDVSAVDLNGYLTDAEPGGYWAASVASDAGAINPATGMLTVTGLPEGIHNFYYIVGEDPCPTDTAIISIEIFEPYSAGADGSTETCSAPGVTVNLNDLLDGNDTGGSWVEVTATGGAFNVATGILDAAALPIGMYVFHYVSATSGPCDADIAVFTVNIIAGPAANFTFSPGSVFTDDTEVTFTNLSTGATLYTWNFGDASPLVTDENPVHEYPAVPGMYDITLVVENELGCSDSITAHIKVKAIVLFYIPNTFTPDGNALNDKFRPVFESGFDPYNFHMQVINRYGETVYESFDASAGWDGTYGNAGIVQEGIYTWVIEFKELDSDRIQRHEGHITIMK